MQKAFLGSLEHVLTGQLEKLKASIMQVVEECIKSHGDKCYQEMAEMRAEFSATSTSSEAAVGQANSTAVKLRA